MRRLIVSIAVCAGATVAGLGDGTAGVVPAQAAPSRRGSALYFYGWSRDSRLIAYTRLRVGRTRPDQRMQRYVEDGEFAGFGKMVGGDVERYARERGYVVVASESRRLSETSFEFAGVGDVPLQLGLEVGRAQSWVLTRGGKRLAEHTFDRIYVGFDAQLFPSPDGTQAVLVMHLDTGWEIDAAIFPVSLIERSTTQRVGNE